MLIPAVSYSQPPTEEQILARIESGIDWLVSQQLGDGSWSEYGEPIATTGFAITKLCDYAIEHGYSPFDPAYEYNSEVVAGFNYIFGTVKTYGAGTGMCATPNLNDHHEIYNAAVALMALAASRSPSEVVPVGLASGLTFLQLQDNMIEYFEWAQYDTSPYGGWRYTPNGGQDNSHTGWVVLALRYAEVNGSVIPTAIKSKLDDYIDYIQCGNGGSGYSSPCYWVNLLKTGNLLTEMAFVGDDVSSQRVQDALTYINNNWNISADPGYGDTQAMYCLLKGFESYGDPAGAPPAWFDDFTTKLFSLSASGGWPNSNWTGPIISTCWALMVLEKVAPPPVCPDDIVVSNDQGDCGAIVSFDVSAHYLATITQTSGLPSGSLFPIDVTDQEFEIDLDGEITYCTFTITVNDEEPPVSDIDPLPDVVSECETTLVPPTATDNCGILTGTTTDPLTYIEQGTYTVTWTYDDGNGNLVTQDQTVIVEDVTPPVITVTEPIAFWQANHRYVTLDLFDIVLGVDDNCASLSIEDVKIVKVTSDEPENVNGNGDGKTFDDMVIGVDCMTVDLRTERQGKGNGRVYTIHLELDDGNGNIGTALCFVHVPHDHSGLAIDDGPIYEVLGNCGMEKSVMIIDKPMEFEGYELTNYPNPFNNSTTIQLTIPVESKVLLKVYNIFGQELQTLLNQKYSSGTYTIQFNGSELPNGQYLYRFETPAYSLTKKMILNR